MRTHEEDRLNEVVSSPKRLRCATPWGIAPKLIRRVVVSAEPVVTELLTDTELELLTDTVFEALIEEAESMVDLSELLTLSDDF